MQNISFYEYYYKIENVNQIVSQQYAIYLDH